MEMSLPFVVTERENMKAEAKMITAFSEAGV